MSLQRKVTNFLATEGSLIFSTFTITDIIMETIELKSQLHRLIDQLNDPVILDQYYEEIKRMVNLSKSGLWDSLNEDQKQEVLLSFEESENDDNLVDHETVMKKYNQWRIG